MKTLKGSSLTKTWGRVWLIQSHGLFPISETCSTLSTLPSGNITLSTRAGTTVATFSCHVGYSLKGPGSVLCLEDGTWSDSLPSCGETLLQYKICCAMKQKMLSLPL